VGPGDDGFAGFGSQSKRGCGYFHNPLKIVQKTQINGAEGRILKKTNDISKLLNLW
jgi:hypothetical protein